MEQILVRSSYDYDYKKVGNSHELYYSNNPEWMDSGKISMHVVDDGNGMDVFIDGESLIRLDYDTAEQLMILLKLINRDSSYEIITEKKQL
jgi:hypothetical protein